MSHPHGSRSNDLAVLLRRLDDDALKGALKDAPDGGGVEPSAKGDLRAFGAAMREELIGAADAPSRASEDLRARRVAQKVLARTTRADDSRRGEVALVLDFVSERLRQSALLRVAAALLVVQLTVVPLVAWHLYRQPEGPDLNISFEAVPESIEDELPLDTRARDIGEGFQALDGFDDLLSDPNETSALRAKLVSIGELRIASGTAPRSPIGRALAGLTAPSALGEIPSDDQPAAAIAAWARLLAFESSGETSGLATALEVLVESRDVDAPNRPNGGRSSAVRALGDRALAHAAGLDLALPPDARPDRASPVWWEETLFELIVEVARTGTNADEFTTAWLRAAE